MAEDETMRDAEPEPSAEPSAEPSVDAEEDDWDAVNAEGTPEATGTEDAGPEESFDTEDEEDEVAWCTCTQSAVFCHHATNSWLFEVYVYRSGLHSLSKCME